MENCRLGEGLSRGAPVMHDIGLREGLLKFVLRKAIV